MKNFTSILVSGVALMWATPSIACQFDGQGNVSVGALMGDASAVGSASVAKLTEEFWKQASFSDAAAAGCTKADVDRKILELNPAGMVPYSGLFTYPLVKPRAAAVSAQPAPGVSAAPAAQASAAPAPVETASAAPPPLAAAATKAAPVIPVVAAPLAVKPLPARIDMSDVWGAINALKTADVAIRSGQVTPEQLTLLSQLGSIPDLEARLRNLPASGEVETSTLPVAQQAAVQQVIAAQSLAEEYLGREFIDFSALLGGLGVILLSLLGALAYWKRNKNIASAAQAAVAAGLADAKLDDTFKLTTLARLNEVESNVQNIGEQTGATDKVDLGEAQLQALAALEIGDELDVDVFIKNEPEAVLRFKRTADNWLVIMTKGIIDYTDGTPIAKPEAFVRKAYRDGRLRLVLSPLVLNQQTA